MSLEQTDISNQGIGDKIAIAANSYKRIADAAKVASDYSSQRMVIYIKAGRYDENVNVGRKRTNLMFVDDQRRPHRVRLRPQERAALDALGVYDAAASAIFV